MLSNCARCKFNASTGDLEPSIGCAINPSYWNLWHHINSVPSQKLASLPISGCQELGECNHFKAMPLYDLNQPCIRQSNDGSWNLMNRIRRGWNETCYVYRSLGELLEKERVGIENQYEDDFGAFFTIASASSPAPRPDQVPFISQTLQDGTIEMVSVESTVIDAIGYDFGEFVLYVRFKRGQLFAYWWVSPLNYENFLSAPSKGRFFNTRIKHFCSYVEVNE